jgi:ferric-dicitrate binding protein FerR (iron transport regulator)
MSNNNHTNPDYMLLGRYFSGEASPEEAIQLEEWLATDSANKQQFEQLSKVWSTISSEEACIIPDKEAFLNQLRERFPQAHTTKTVSLINKLTWLKIAASIIFIAGAVLLFTVLRNNVQPQSAIAITRQTQQNILNDTLPDGSQAVISNNSRLQYPTEFNEASREVILNGEAWFNVTPNPAQPFIITAGPLHIKVIGTSFNVRTINDIIEVSVKTGIVRMYNDTDSLTVTARQKGTYQISTRQFVLKEKFNPNEVAYATKYFNFENATLKEITDQLQKAYGLKIIISNKNLENCTLSSSFDNKPIEYIFDVLAMTLNIQYRIEQKKVYISGSISCTY